MSYRGIARIREQLGKQQGELAEEAGNSQAQLSRYESGVIKRPSHDALQAIANAMGVEIKDLVDDDRPRFSKTPPLSSAVFDDLHDDSQQQKINQHYAGQNMRPGKPQLAVYKRQVPARLEFEHSDAIIGDYDAAAQMVDKPPFVLAREGGYAIKMPSDAMKPRFNDGDILYVDPDVGVKVNDDVAVTFEHQGYDLILVRKVHDIKPEGVYVGPYEFETDDHEALILLDEQDKQWKEMHVIVGMSRDR